MKVLRVIRSLHPATGGPAVGISSFARALDRLGCTTTVVTLDSPESPWLSSLDYDFIACGPVFGSFGYKPRLVTFLRELCSEYDAVIIDGIWQYHSYATYLALRSSTIPYYVYTHGMLDPWFKRKYPLKHLKKLLYWNLFEYYVLKSATRVLFTAQSEMNLAAQSFHRYSTFPQVVGFGVEPPPQVSQSDVDAFLTCHPHLSCKRIFLFLGRLHPKKGLELLIQGFCESVSVDPTAHLLIGGTGASSYVQTLKGLVNQLGMSSHITFVGHLDGVQKWAAFSIAELFCLSSYQENFGVAVVEALACGLPVLLSSSINIAQEVSSSSAGFVINPCVSDVAAALTYWMQSPDSLKLNMSAQASQLYFNSFTIDSAAERLFRVITSA